MWACREMVPRIWHTWAARLLFLAMFGPSIVAGCDGDCVRVYTKVRKLCDARVAMVAEKWTREDVRKVGGDCRLLAAEIAGDCKRGGWPGGLTDCILDSHFIEDVNACARVVNNRRRREKESGETR